MKRLGDYLVEENVCTKENIQQALEQQALLRKDKVFRPLGTILVDHIGVTFRELDKCLVKMHVDILAQTQIFTSLTKENLEKTASIAEQQVLSENELVFNKGDKADTFFIVVSGKVKIYITSADGTENILATLFPGDGFGEMALLTEEPRSASVKTLESSSFLVFSKKYFEQLCDIYPEISRAFIKILSNRITNGNEEILNSAETERAYQRLVSTQTEIPFHPFVGQSRAIQKIKKQITMAAANTDPVLLFSETGTMKSSLAKAIHKESIYGDGPFLSVDAKTVSLDYQVTPSSDASEDNLQLELFQSTSLFGHEQDALPFVKTKKLGVLQVCQDGTVVIQNIEKLTLSVQELLFEYLQTGLFKTIGGHLSIPSGARIIGATSVNLEPLVKEGAFLDKLYELMSRQIISIPPLRRRKSDLQDIVQSMIEHFNGPAGKTVKGIEPEANQRIMSYDWPGNMGELEVVLRRAVNLARHDRLIPEDIFIGMAPSQGKHVVNLLNYDFFRKIFVHKMYPTGLQIGTTLFFLVLFLMAFLGSQSADANITVILVWAIWWPALVVSWFFGARIWCSICPMGTMNDVLNRFCSLKLKVPMFIRNNGIYLSALGLCFIIWVEAASGMSYSPMATGVLLLSILFFAMLSGLFYERRLWCRYLCPLGRLAAVFSACSLVEFRSNSSICNSTCKDNSCYKGKDGIPGCPVYQGPFSLRSNQNCILCGNCVKICENMSPVFNLRAPGHELWAVIKPERVTAIFVPVIIGTQFFRGLEHTDIIHYLSVTTGQNWLVLAGLMVVVVCAAFGYVKQAGNMVFGKNMDGSVGQADLFNYVLIPLSFSFEIGYQFGPLLERVGHFFTVLGHQVGLNLDFLDFSSIMGSAMLWQILFLLLGSIGSLVVLAKLMLKQETSVDQKIVLKNYIPVALLSIFYLYLFVTI